MLKNQITITLRNLLRQKGYTFINISGLTIGIICCLLILLYVSDERSYDRYNENADRIYRLGVHGILGPNEFSGVVTPAPMGETFAQEMPEVVAATRIRSFGFPVITYEDRVFSEELFFWADSTIFDIFTIPFLKGDPKTALSEPNTVVFTQSMAEKYFGDGDPMGKLVHLNNGTTYTVTGVIKDFPHNSHFHFDFIGSMVSYQRILDNIWISNNFYTYVLLRDDVPAEQFEAKLPTFIEKYAIPQIEEATGASFQSFITAGGLYEWFAQPLTDIHLYSRLEHEIEPNGNATYVYIFSIVAIGILIIACINFMNLSTARSMNRAREVGVRKTLGSTRIQLIRQFLIESIFLTFVALLLALLIVSLVLPYYNTFLGKQLSVDLLGQYTLLPAILLVTVLVGVLAGGYPAFFMASFNTVEVLKGKLESRRVTGQILRSSLVVFQFGISAALIAGTIIIAFQLNFIQNKDLGFTREQLVVVEKTDDIGEHIESFKEQLLKNPRISAVSNSTRYIGQNFGSNVFTAGGATANETHIIWTTTTDFDFASTYQVQMKEGRFYSREFGTDSTGIVINEAAATVLGLTDPIGKEIVMVGPSPEFSVRFPVIGVMNDFHFESLHQDIRPLVILPFQQGGFGRYVSVRVNTENIRETLNHIERTWHTFAENQAFEYFFFDEEYGRLYASERQTQRLMAVFSLLAVFIACLGLFGLSSFSAEKRTKEIGVRKAMGATVFNIVLMLLKDFLKLVVISNIIALPVIYFVMNNWLQGFAYRIAIRFEVFVITILVTFVVAIVTVSYQAIRAALTNPTSSLRYE